MNICSFDDIPRMLQHKRAFHGTRHPIYPVKQIAGINWFSRNLLGNTSAQSRRRTPYRDAVRAILKNNFRNGEAGSRAVLGASDAHVLMDL